VEDAAVPVPVRVAVCGEPVTLSATEMLAANVVADSGVKVTEIVQVALAASVVLQVFEEMAKSDGFVPVIVMPLMFSVAVPGFDNVIDCAADVVLTV